MAKKKYNPDPKIETAARIGRTEAYAEKVRQLFAATVNDILALNKTLPDIAGGVMYSFDGDTKKIQAKVELLLRRLHSVALMAIERGIRLEWSEANAECDKLVRHCFGQNAMNNPRYAGYTNRNAEAMEAFIKRSDRGMNLSDRVWQSCRQLRDEMEVAITVAAGEGEDAGTISRKVRQYLNDPDLMFRRFQYQEKEPMRDADGNIVYGKDGKPKLQAKLGKDGKPIWRKKWKKRIADPDNPGRYKWIDYDRDSYIPKGAGTNSRGVYKSSAKNAMRLARTETNIAYRRADNERWSQMDFVIGQRVQLSKSHPKKDICDKLAGDYPKDFVFEGWHPQCFCFVTPILMDEDEFLAMEDARLAGKPYKPKVKPITDYPAEFKDWVRENEDKITDRSTSNPYFIEHNQPIIAKILRGEEFETPEEEPELTILEKAKIRHDARTEEEKQDILKRYAARKEAIETGEEYGKKFEGIKDVDTSALDDAMSRADWDAVRAEVAKLKQIEAEILALDKLDDPMEVARKFSVADAKTVNAAVISRMARETFSTLEAKKKWLESEIKWTEDHKKYATWEVACDAYKKELAEVERGIEVKGVADSVKDAILFAKTQSTDPTLKSLAAEMEAALANTSVSLDELKIKATDLNAKYNAEYAKVKAWIDLQTKAATAITYASTTTDAEYKKKADEINLMLSTRSLAISTATKKVNEFIKEYQELYKKEISAKYGTSPIVSVSDLIAKLGSDTPATIKELEDAIKKFKYSDPDFKANEAEINAIMKKLFEENDYGMDIKAAYLESVCDNGLYNTFQSGSSMGYNGSSKTSGAIEQDHGRLKMAHRMFFPSTHGDLKNGKYTGHQYERQEYERYGHLLDRDKYECYQHNRTHYGGYGDGSVQVRFKKDKVICTWTFDDSLHSSGHYFQPSLTTDPRIESFDEMCYHRPNSSENTSSVADWQRSHGTSYIELQYHGELTMDMVESLTFAKNPEDIISEALINRLLLKGIELWYVDGTKVVRYCKS